MSNFNLAKLFVFLGPLIFFAGTEYVLFNPRHFLNVFYLITLITVILLLGVIKPNLRQKEKIKYFILPFLYIISLASFVVLLKNNLTAHVFSFIASSIYGWLLWVIASLMAARDGKTKQFYGRFYDVFIICTFLLFCSALLSLQTYLDLAPWIILLLLFIISALLFYQRLWFYDIMKREWWVEIVAFGFLMTQIAWATLFWPIANLPVAFFLLVVFYSLANVWSLALTHTLTAKSLKKVLWLSALVVVVVLASTRWIL
ncbi:MAG: hypothetical protein ACD_68C00134G0001 [uncultured bacterium]|nr:MAG: hypothetical protein ACD_68C00134G0001 [uncultured bacterium]